MLNLIRTFVYVLYEVMSGIHFDDGELQRICAEESVWGCKEKENESESLAVDSFFLLRRTMFVTSILKRVWIIKK